MRDLDADEVGHVVTGQLRKQTDSRDCVVESSSYARQPIPVQFRHMCKIEFGEQPGTEAKADRSQAASQGDYVPAG